MYERQVPLAYSSTPRSNSKISSEISTLNLSQSEKEISFFFEMGMPSLYIEEMHTALLCSFIQQKPERSITIILQTEASD
jgi:hypothetical protein